MKCARTACNNAAMGFIHVQTGAIYCATCARLINDANGVQLVVQPRVARYEMIRIEFPCSCYDTYLRPLNVPGPFRLSDSVSLCQKLHPGRACHYDQGLSEDAAKQAE